MPICTREHALDARALEEALFNLAVNARDAMPHRGRMHFEARLAEPDHGAADSGAGMTIDTSQRAALPFFTTKANDPLAGLGLAAVEGFREAVGRIVAVADLAGRRDPDHAASSVRWAASIGPILILRTTRTCPGGIARAAGR